MHGSAVLLGQLGVQEAEVVDSGHLLLKPEHGRGHICRWQRVVL